MLSVSKGPLGLKNASFHFTLFLYVFVVLLHLASITSKFRSVLPLPWCSTNTRSYVTLEEWDTALLQYKPAPSLYYCWQVTASRVLKLYTTLDWTRNGIMSLLRLSVRRVNWLTRNILFFNPLAPEFFFRILAHPVYKMWILQGPKKIALWNKRRLEEREKKRRMCSMFKIFSKYICWINI